jgi:hypothetical protein
MLATKEEIQISETTTSFRVNLDNVNFEKTLDECYQKRRNYVSESEHELQQKPMASEIKQK